MKISLIAAIGKNRELGDAGKIPWHISEDFKRFKQLTLNHPIIMGRKTWDSLPKKPLPNRTNIIVSSKNIFNVSKSDTTNSVFVFQNLNSALREAKHIAKQQGKDEVFVIGGGQIFAQAISLADKLYLTIIEDEFKADTFFPDYSEFKKVVFEKPGEEGNYKYKFIDLEK